MATYVDIGFATFVNDASTGIKLWLAATEAKTDDGDFTFSCITNQRTYYLVAKQLATSISTNFTILGFELIYQAIKTNAWTSVAPSDIRDNSIFLVYNGSFVGTDKAATAVTWTTNESTYTKGNSTYLGGMVWTAEMLNSTQYAWAISARNHNSYGGFAGIDYVKSRIHYRVGADVSQSVKLAEAFSRIVSYYRDFTETIKLSDSANAILISVRNASQEIKLNATGSAYIVYGRNLTQASKLTETCTVKLSYNRSGSQLLKLNAIGSIYKITPNSFLTNYKPKWLVDMNLSSSHKFSHEDIYITT